MFVILMNFIAICVPFLLGRYNFALNFTVLYILFCCQVLSCSCEIPPSTFDPWFERLTIISYVWLQSGRRPGGLMVSALISGSSGPGSSPGACFLKAPETFRAHKAIFHSSGCKNGDVYTPETSCMNWTSLHTKTMWIKQLCNCKVRDFALALRVRKVSGAFEKRAPGQWC